MYIVKDENTLGYTIGTIRENKPVTMVVMRVDVEAGGDPLLIDRTTCAVNYREATKEDEERFQVILS